MTQVPVVIPSGPFFVIPSGPFFVIPSVVEGQPPSNEDCGGPSTTLGMTKEVKN
jgi:hypothetical protein